MANLPDFNRTKIRGGETPFVRPVLPGEYRLLPQMQERIPQDPRLPQRSLPQAQMSPEEFLTAYLLGSRSSSAGFSDFDRVLADIKKPREPQGTLVWDEISGLRRSIPNSISPDFAKTLAGIEMASKPTQFSPEAQRRIEDYRASEILRGLNV